MTRHGPTVLVADEFGPLISIGGAVSESLTLEQRIERAEQEVIRLTGSGPGGSLNRSFRMTIPAEPDRDSDLILMDGLKAGREALELAAQLAYAVTEGKFTEALNLGQALAAALREDVR